MDAGIGDEAIDEDFYAVFDKDKNDKISLEEFKAGWGDIGPNGEAVKEYCFKRVDRLAQANGELSLEDFFNAANIIRSTVLGY